MPHFIHLMSGGLDSTVLLFDLLDQGNWVTCLLFDYNQKHKKELTYAARTCESLGLQYDRIYLPHQIFQGSSLTGRNGDMEGAATIVPNRNMVFISMAASYALRPGITGTAVSWAANADDAEHYPDCRPEYLTHLNRTLRICHTRRMEVHAPYITRTKRQIVERGRALGVDFDKTWSCYSGADEPCNKCGACQVRNAALSQES